MTPDEKRMQYTKIAIGIAFALYFLWWSQMVLTALNVAPVGV